MCIRDSAWTASQQVVIAIATDERVRPHVASQVVIASTTDDAVVAGLAVKLVVAVAAIQYIIARPTAEDVIASQAVQGIVASQAINLVVTSGAGQCVVSRGAHDGVRIKTTQIGCDQIAFGDMVQNRYSLESSGALRTIGVQFEQRVGARLRQAGVTAGEGVIPVSYTHLDVYKRQV